MKIRFKKYTSSLLAVLLFASCENLDEVNVNPNSAEEVSSNYLVSYVLTNTARSYYNLGAEGRQIPCAMQYTQYGPSQNVPVVNHYGWTAQNWGEYYEILRNVKLIYENSQKDDNLFFRAVALTMRSFIFGLMTDLFGDIPYSEALKATTGSYFPAYDEQKNVYKGILEDLKEADRLLSNLSPSDGINATTDVMFKGDSQKWRKFTNALRLRYVLRVIEKKSEMSALGINLEEEFKNASAFTFTSNADDALVSFLGINRENSTPGGLLNAANPEFTIKAGKPFVDRLFELNDPRLHRWVQPVQRKWSLHTKVEKDTIVTNSFNESFTVTLVPAAGISGIDTSLYVGQPIGIPVVEISAYNKGTDETAYHPERNPYISFLHDRYRKNSDTYIQMNLITYAEVEFILAEAAELGGLGVSDSESHYKNAIRAAMDKYGVSEAKAFKFDDYYQQQSVDLSKAANRQERIIEQKWISSWLNIQSWFDWRRTGYPALKTGPVAQFGPAIPVRYMYPVPNLDPVYLVNYDGAVNRLESTSYIPSGQSRDHAYAKMWLIQGTGKPW